MMPPRPIVVIPGIQGSSLDDYYPLDPSQAWSTLGIVENKIFGPDFDSLALDDTASVDLSPEIVLRPYQALSIAYAPLVRSLRGRQDAPVYLYPYDWRYSIAKAAQKLAELLAAVLVKNKSLAGWDGRVNLVCHSLGGLVLRACLGSGFDASRLGRIVFVAVPHRGAVDAIEMMIRGETSLLGGAKQMRKLARTYPSVYELLPQFACATMAGADLDIWNEANWQDNVLADDPNGFNVEQRHLDDARLVVDALPSPAHLGIPLSDLLTIYGTGHDTIARFVVSPNPAEKIKRWYDFDHAATGDGDGVVLATSAIISGLPTVEIAEADISYLALRARYGNMHAFLPTLDEVSTIVSRFFAGISDANVLPRGIPPARFRVAA